MRLAAPILSVAIAWVPWALAWGDDFRDAMQAGQGAGAQLRSAVTVPTTAGSTLNLFPGNRAGDVSFSTLFPGAQNGGAGTFSAYYGDHTGAVMQGQNAQSALMSTDSPTGAGYRTLRATLDRSRPDMRNDPLWSQTDDVLTNFAAISRTFAECTLATTFKQSERQTHVADLRTCNRLEKLGGSCALYHDYSIADTVGITPWGGALKQSCGSGCTQITYNHQESANENMGRGYPSSPAPQTFGYTVADSRRVTSASVSVAPSGPSFGTFQIDQYTERYQVNFDNYSYYAASGASFEYVNRPGLSMDWTAYLKDGASFTIANDFAFRTTGPREWWRGTAPYTVTVTLHHALKVTDRGWSNNPHCRDLAKTLRGSGGFCAGNITCTASPPLGRNGCYVAAGGTVCPRNVQPSPIPGVNALCRQATVTSDCSVFNRGPMPCWIDAQGHQQCPFNEGTTPTDCTELEQNPQCGFLKSVCVPGAQDANGNCYLHEETWDCGTLHSIPVLDRLSTMDCAGPVRCMGTDCASFPSEQSTDFAKAAAGLQAAQMAASDMTCDAGGDCTVFTGSPQECKRAVGGIVNCCKTPGTTNMTDYITLVTDMVKIDNALMSLDQQNVVRGAWETLRGPVSSTWSAIQETFTSAANNLMGNVAPAATQEAEKAVAQGITQTIMQDTAQWAAQTFGDAAVNLLFSTTTGGSAVVNGAVQGTLQLGGGAALLGAVLVWVMWAYLVYQIVMILIKIIWTCEKDEFALGAKRELKTCVGVGGYCKSKVLGYCVEKRDAYCCFTTPLARILQEQVRPQLGRGWGAPDRPDCRGLKISELEQVDWNRVNLDEWLSILVETGHFPTMDKLNIEDLTGTSSVLSTNGQRPNAAARSTQRTDGINSEQVRKDAAGGGWSATLPALP
ncbi:conjugal transfer protein TraN [uncultured Thiodictyon sp.]|uniref:conjugal transfer protein TraN n=1 Tax=uncultured Thiodictyon sp. TaxID=1846217 RepID=UPI0025EAFC0E|nr:conjugal transfer protein TraN [uncultured Thiodictyon sp.]